jgi:hypothetical protein
LLASYSTPPEPGNGIAYDISVLDHILTEGVDWPNCRKCSFLNFFPTCNLNIVKNDHVHQKEVKIGYPRSHFWPQITSNGPTAPPWDHFSFPKLGIYDFLSPCDHPACSKIEYKEVQK